MPAATLYFRDPDGHMLEYLTMLDEPVLPEAGIVAWSEWRQAPRGRRRTGPADARALGPLPFSLVSSVTVTVARTRRGTPLSV